MILLNQVLELLAEADVFLLLFVLYPLLNLKDAMNLSLFDIGDVLINGILVLWRLNVMNQLRYGSNQLELDEGNI